MAIGLRYRPTWAWRATVVKASATTVARYRSFIRNPQKNYADAAHRTAQIQVYRKICESMSDCGRNRNLRAGTGGSGKAKSRREAQAGPERDQGQPLPVDG